ncbi:hypothetical protein [Sphingobium yanoikuyae]|jgi:hypothetical protein|uniref:hypothetical protein n=1 Tax=Sphingobium yanoikuyae TaxID=13690 RepID=UPI00137849AE|nr:hypothetical protein [Sphingobium yanoikuyae]NBB39132.1 hypothetical protein [Sphingobium yanoikuyae]
MSETDENATSGPQETLPDHAEDEPILAPRWSFQFLERATASAPRQSSPGPAGPGPSAPSPREDPIIVLRALDEKIRKLRQCISALEALLDVTIDPQKRAPLSEQLDAAVRERDICRARFNQIDRGGPFKAPPEGEEARLLEAIRIVSQRLANTQQWERLLTAIDGLVQAYAGKKTEPAAAADA